ncbi:MAG: DUF3891 family protein [Gemmatimonadetes bacterium]|nr:DUF3891 family protein [Gemmatimonadota bacterium]
MLVQTRSDSLFLVPQHDHALLSGEMADAWVGLGAEPEPLSAAAVTGIAMHDVGWTLLDDVPRFNAETGRPHGFETHPEDGREILYRDGPALAHDVHPWAGLLGADHYARFDTSETARRRLREQLTAWKAEVGWGAAKEQRLERDGAHLRLLDVLSLHVCLSRPESVAPPDWLASERIGKDPDGRPFRLEWTDGADLVLDPYPFRSPVTCRVRGRELPAAPFGDQEALSRAWEAAQWTEIRTVMRPA